MAGDTDITIEIGPDGIQYTERGTLGPMQQEYPWQEVTSVEVDVNNVTPNGSDDVFPIEISGEVVIGEASDDPDEASEDTGSIYDEIFAETGIMVDPEEEQVAFDPEKDQSENFKRFFEYLFESNLITMDDLPFQTPHQENYVLNTEKKHPRKEMRRPKEVISGVWLETSIPIDQKKYHIREAAANFIEE